MRLRRIEMLFATWLAWCAGCAGGDGGEAATDKEHGGAARAGDAGADRSNGAVSTRSTSAPEFHADAGDGWVALAMGHWKIPANSERYFCLRQTVTRDVALRAFRPVAPLGTHHDAIGVWSTALAKDGVSECSPNAMADRSLVAGGVGTGDYELPDGIAIRLHEGEQVAVNLHLFNASDEPLEGTSGILARTVAEDEVEHFAESVLGGPLMLEIPPGRVEQSGQCTMANDTTIFAVGPHMHQKGVHMKIVAESSLDGTTTLFDGDYSFEQQLLHAVNPVRMKQDDALKVYCTYDNDTDQTLHFGNSTLDEMCLAEILRYPESPTPAALCPR